MGAKKSDGVSAVLCWGPWLGPCELPLPFRPTSFFGGGTSPRSLLVCALLASSFPAPLGAAGAELPACPRDLHPTEGANRRPSAFFCSRCTALPAASWALPPHRPLGRGGRGARAARLLRNSLE